MLNPTNGQGVATHALRVERRTRINFYDRFSDDVSTPLSPAKAVRRVSERASESEGAQTILFFFSGTRGRAAEEERLQ